MTNKLISIVGPTGVGKTSFVLWLVDQLLSSHDFPFTGIDLISADSRQVYRDLKVISGADVPPGFIEHSSEDPAQYFFEKEKCRIYGLLMLPYQAEWSVSHFRAFALQVVKRSWSNNRLPIIIGGTGLYHQHLFNPSPILDIKPDLKLRLALAEASVEDLQTRLQKIAPERFQRLNDSDRHNPTRLVRAIEIANWEANRPTGIDTFSAQESILPDQQLIIGLTDDLETIRQKIADRVGERFANGAKQEVEKLTDRLNEFGPNKQLLSATGVKEVQAFLNGQIEKPELLEKWTLREFQYAKRQLTWWKNKPDVNWFKVGDQNWRDEAYQLVQKLILPSRD